MIDKSDKKLMASSDRVSATFREKLLRIGKGQHTPHIQVPNFMGILPYFT